MFEIVIVVVGTAIVIAAYKNIRHLSKAKKLDYQLALEETQLIKEFVENSERIKRWKLIQGKCQFFSNAYKNDKNSKTIEISDVADQKLEEWIAGRLDEAFAINDDEYCRAAAFGTIAEFMADAGQFERAQKIIALIKIDIIRDNALEKHKQLEVRYPGCSIRRPIP